jgi:predicted RNA-binding protein
MVAVQDRARRIRESHEKICKPFALDESLCLYSPQDNVDALAHPRVRDWLRFITTTYVPDLGPGKTRVLLLMPCTKTKPYVLSTEHKRINQTLLGAGFRPTRDLAVTELADRLESEFSREVLNLAPLRNRNGTIIHRAVISEPLAFVPYEHMLTYENRASPATAYDDPGLFENRGNAVSPWRHDFTATAISPTRWRWGHEEVRKYVIMHNAMAETLAKVVMRVAPHYTRRIAWVAPGLTHRSFVIARTERKAHGITSFRKVGTERLRLTGANDFLPDMMKLECLPSAEQCRDARERLASRLGRKISQVGGIYSRGGGDATPLVLPELLENLIAALSK